jgi:hypothetical protein
MRIMLRTREGALSRSLANSIGHDDGDWNRQARDEEKGRCGVRMGVWR